MPPLICSVHALEILIDSMYKEIILEATDVELRILKYLLIANHNIVKWRKAIILR